MNEYNLIDSTGKRYKENKGVREYEPEIVVSGTCASIPYGQYERMQETEKCNEYTEPEEQKLCPFGLLNCSPCRKDCVFYIGKLCRFVAGIKTNRIDVTGKFCPFGKSDCVDNCAWNNGGCAFLGKDESYE